MNLRKTLTALSLVCLAAFPAGAAPGQFRGHWRCDGQLKNKDGSPAMSWFVEYEFKDDDSYIMRGYPPVTETGKVEFQTVEGGYKLNLSQRILEGNKQRDIVYPATMSTDGKTLHFNGKDFIRPKK